MHYWSAWRLFGLLAVTIALAAFPGLAKDPEGPDPFANLSKASNADIDRHARNAPKEAEGSVAKLAEYIASKAKDDREKARGLFTWMTTRIAYDHDAARTGAGERDPEKVMQIRRATCDGQSRLYEALAKASGLEVMRIVGEARMLDEQRDIPKELVKRTDRGTSYVGHGWNAVKIGGKWHALDVTWANRRDYTAGKITERGSANDYYFLVPPEQMIYTHLPKEEKWQLLEKPFSRQDQDALPRLRGAMFKYGLGLVSHPKDLISTEPNLKMTLTTPADVVLLVTLLQDGKEIKDPMVLVQRTTKEAEVQVCFPKPGDYSLRLSAANRSENTYGIAVEYSVEVKPGDKPALMLPQANVAFQRVGGYLHSPVTGTLKAGKSVAFKVSLPGATGAFLKNGERTARMVKSGQYYVATVVPARGEVVLCVEDASSPRRGQGLQAVTYTVE